MPSSPQQPRPYVFIGSSSEGHRIAEAIQANLERYCDAVIWSQGVFGLSGGTLESLVDVADDFDFAVLVVTADDILTSRGQEQQAPRDNVLLEIGLFIGAMGRERTFVVFDTGADIKLPSDLAGVTLAGFELRGRGTLQAALGPSCFRINEAMEGLGVLVKPGQLRSMEGVYAVYPTPGQEVVGERIVFTYVGRRTFSTESVRPQSGTYWEGYVTMSDQLPGYGNGIFRYLTKDGCGLHQIWVNPRNGSIDVHGVNTVGGTNPEPFTFTLRKMNG